jgi:hypothetical protein
MTVVVIFFSNLKRAKAAARQSCLTETNLSSAELQLQQLQMKIP